MRGSGLRRTHGRTDLRPDVGSLLSQGRKEVRGADKDSSEVWWGFEDIFFCDLCFPQKIGTVTC